MKQNNTSKKRSGMPRLLILLALALFLIAYLTLPAVSRPINRAAAVLGSANVDAVVEYIPALGKLLFPNDAKIKINMNGEKNETK